MTQNKPLKECCYTDTQYTHPHLRDNGLTEKDVFTIFPYLEVKEAVELLKVKLTFSKIVKFENVNEILNLIDECFQIFAEKKEE